MLLMILTIITLFSMILVIIIFFSLQELQPDVRHSAVDVGEAVLVPHGHGDQTGRNQQGAGKVPGGVQGENQAGRF